MATNLVIKPEVAAVLKERGIKEDEVKTLVDWAETTKEKFVDPGKNLHWTTKKMGNANLSAIYKPSGAGLELVTAFSYKVMQKAITDYILEDTTDWVYAKTNEKVTRITADWEYIGVSRLASALGCKSCPTAYLEEYMATKTIAIAQMLLEKKKGV
jgi:hypothetical protein